MSQGSKDPLDTYFEKVAADSFCPRCKKFTGFKMATEPNKGLCPTCSWDLERARDADYFFVGICIAAALFLILWPVVASMIVNLLMK